MASLTEKAGLLTLANIFSRAATILSGIIVVRWLSQQDLGTFRQVNLIFSTSSIILLLGIPTSLYYFLPRAQEHEKRGIITQTLITLGLIGLVSSIILFFLASHISSAFHNPDISALIRRYSPYLVFYLPGAAYFAVMMCMDRVAAAAIGGICITLSQIVATIIPLILHYSLLTIFTSMLITGIIVSMLAVWFCLRVTPKGSLFPPKGFGVKQFKFSLPLGMSQVVGMVSKEIDKFFISTFFSVKDFATYSVGAIELPITALIAPSIHSVLLPKFSRDFQEDNFKKILQIWRTSRRKLALITFPIILFFFIISSEFIRLLYGDRYSESVSIFQIYLLVPLLANFETGVILHARGKPNLLLYVTAINCIFNLILNFIFIRLIGVIGPSIATVIATTIGLLACARWSSFELYRKPWNLFPFSEYARILLASAIAGAPILFIKVVGLVSSKLEFLLLSIISYGGILLLMYFIFVLTNDDYKILYKYLSWVPFVGNFVRYMVKKGRLL